MKNYTKPIMHLLEEAILEKPKSKHYGSYPCLEYEEISSRSSENF